MIPMQVTAPPPGLKCALLRAIGVVALVVLGLTPARAGDAPRDLRAQIEALANAHGFAVVGQELLQATPAEAQSGDDPVRAVRAILGDYNYLLVHRRDGGIRQLRIIGAKLPIQPRYTVKTTRRGAHHLVEAVLVGPNGTRQTISLILDTGASTIVLPSSMIEELGFLPNELKSGMASTANGSVAIRLGKLQEVQIGHAKASDVAVGFIADDKIGQKYLLGMSFLDRFRMTIDDDANRLTLLAK